MWTEKNAWQNDERTEYARKWRLWYLAAGEWKEIFSDLVEGLERKEMVVQYGGYADAPMISRSRQGDESSCIDIAVYSLDKRKFTDEEMAQWRAYDDYCGNFTGSDLDWKEYYDYTEQWDKDHPDLAWLTHWEPLHPAEYMVFIDYNAENGDTIETHHIYCCTYPDLLEVLRLHA